MKSGTRVVAAVVTAIAITTLVATRPFGPEKESVPLTPSIVETAAIGVLGATPTPDTDNFFYKLLHGEPTPAPPEWLDSYQRSLYERIAVDIDPDAGNIVMYLTPLGERIFKYGTQDNGKWTPWRLTIGDTVNRLEIEAILAGLPFDPEDCRQALTDKYGPPNPNPSKPDATPVPSILIPGTDTAGVPTLILHPNAAMVRFKVPGLACFPIKP